MDVEGKVVVVTGASSGIGAAFARLAGQNGARVVLAARRKQRIDELAAELSDAIAVPTDVTDFGQLDALIAAAVGHFGRIDVLVNNAGQGLHVPVAEVTIDDLDAVMRLNVYAPLVAMQKVFPLMRAQGAGAIVNISSGTSRMVLPGVGAYAATKCALNQLSLTARAEWAADNVVVSVVYPSVTQTEFHSSLRAGAFAGNPRFPGHTPEHVAEAILGVLRSGEAEAIIAHG
jgi:short-subunit dehydrogenase